MSPTSAVTVQFEHVSKRYDPSEKGPGAVNDLSLDVPAGKICILVGPSGCGKTTSLKMVNRLIEPTSGRILIDGRDIATEDPIGLRRRIGYVIQQVGLFPHLTIGDNVSVVPRLLGWDRTRQMQRSNELLELVGLAPERYARRYPSQLSGGERQRVGVARALAADPPVMLMDEPFGAVDPIVRERLQNEFLRLQAELAKTILFVTHDIDEAIKLGDLVAVMQVGGTLAQFATPAEILSNPASDFVARFVGADRGLKRLSLTKVSEVEPKPAFTAHSGEEAATVRARAHAASVRYVLLVDAQDRPIGWIATRSLPEAGRIGEELAESMSPIFEPANTLKDALGRLLGAGVEAGIVVDDAGRVRGLLTFADFGELLRGWGCGVVDLAWVLDHLDDLASRTIQHIALASIALVVGFVISLGLAILAVRRRGAYGPIVAISDILYVIPSLAIFAALVSVTGISLLTVEIPLVMYTFLIYVRNIAAGFDSIPVDVLEAADGMGFTRWRRLVNIELPLAVPLIVAGVRLASVSTIGLVTITSVLGDSFGGLGYFILEGYHRSFPTEIYFGAIPSILLAVIADLAFVRIQRRATPWSQTSALGRLA